MEKIFKFTSKQDGLVLEGICMEPDNQAKGIIQIVHGMAEHKERYLPFMRYLCAKDYVVIIHDHRGHGQSIKESDDLGYFYDTAGKSIYMDAHDIGLEFKEQYQLPLILFGHSMGSLVVREICKYYDKDIDQLIVCGSPSQNKAVDAAILLTKGLSKIYGDHHRSRFINNLAFSSYDKKFKGLKNAWLSENEKNVLVYNDDPLCGFTFTLNGFLNLFLLMKDVYDLNNWKITKPHLPILFIAGSEDPCINSKEDWLEAQNLLRKIGYDNIQNHLYEHMRHEILNEDNALRVYEDVLSFIEY
ncbi:alpha/beta hydrolase [Floccifex sp.]|uniref:alpha/beta hydrolase n=1 Tax=Floccifex sp. TaxID=2815810 RepID=UPI002A75FF6C|nr:alpha/beta fold hydrolase [Floccifex sp.]MDD7281474.1 alpha/beta fold hydrolase [Erysipelotrichaceae bacterium]MDY2957725.1 alpha/beta fold hydrolase [Floccifex sp.]